MHGELGSMIPCWYGLAKRQCKVVGRFFLFLINSTKTTNIYNCSFFELLIKNLKCFSYLCSLCVLQCCLNWRQTLFPYLHSVTQLYLNTLSSFMCKYYTTLHICLFMYMSSGKQYRNVHVTCVSMSLQPSSCTAYVETPLQSIACVHRNSDVMPSAPSGKIIVCFKLSNMLLTGL